MATLYTLMDARCVTQPHEIDFKSTPRVSFAAAD